METAKLNGHSEKLAGLNSALNQVSDYCTNEDLKNELLEKLEESKIEIDEYQSELNEAMTYQEEDKVHKYQRKIEEEQLEIDMIERELSLLL
ncbi:hypothetical protein VSU01S_17870 [Vibrio superstes NBRC 103154]|uniref:Uncharacterized protein n=2 Tax=Vibrio superstes TaxID=198815 RepID=A0A511QSK9_9VIBR|nr:hypothetical protein VSU01S_17870 [Vibrio superstes NBRC 103154]